MHNPINSLIGQVQTELKDMHTLYSSGVTTDDQIYYNAVYTILLQLEATLVSASNDIDVAKLQHKLRKEHLEKKMADFSTTYLDGYDPNGDQFDMAPVKCQFVKHTKSGHE